MSDDLLARFLVAEEDEESLGPCVTLTRKPPLMFELAWVNGNRQAVSYPMLMSVQFNPSTGLVLISGGLRFRVRGRCLAAVFEGLREHRVVQMCEADLTNLPVETDVPVIDGILDESPPRRGGSATAQE